jgi:hypothetical protein
MFQQRQNPLEVFGQRRRPLPLLAAVVNPQFLGVKELSFQSVFLAKSFVESKVTVLVVHDDRIPELGKVEADLMQPAGCNAHAHEGRF